jgi:hypothetical protein
MERITTYTSIGGIPYRKYGLTSTQTEEFARQCPLHRVVITPEIEKKISLQPVRPSSSFSTVDEAIRGRWRDRNEALIERMDAAGMKFIYAQTGNIKVDVRYFVRDSVESGDFFGPWTYFYFMGGVDVMGFSEVADAMRFRMIVEHYDHMRSIPANFENQISSESPSVL